MARAPDMIDEAALDWIVRMGDPAFDDWDAFAGWLEADPQHAARYHALEADATDMAGLIPAAPIRPVLAPPARPLHRRRWIVGAIAASVAGIIGYGAIQIRPAPYLIETQPGVSRTIALADGSSIALNGATRLTLDHHDDRVATLEQGEAYFAIRHDEAHPFRVKVGENELLDVGTAFDVVQDRDGMRVGVAEGAVLFNPHKDAMKLTPGRFLQVENGTMRIAAVARESVGGWRQGSLDYTGEPLRQVATDLSRALGVAFTVSPRIAARPFRGTIALDGLRQDPAPLAPLLDVGLRRVSGGWEIAPLP
jgi:transmembrane sensor